jgi:uncharacterized protein
MQILADADALPKGVKDILYRAAVRVKVKLVMVANTKLSVPESEWISAVIVPEGPDAADDWIAGRITPGDLAITADIPLADRVVTHEGFAINPRGELYTRENVKQKLAGRDLMYELRNIGIQTDGPAPFREKDKRAFADQLDRFLTRYLKSKE